MLVLNVSNLCIWNLQKKVWTITFFKQDLSQFSCSYKFCLTHFNLKTWKQQLYLWFFDAIRRCRNRILAWNGFSSVMIKMVFLFSALWAARDQCGIKYCFQRIYLSIIRRHSNVVWQWFSSVSTWIHHGGWQHVFIECLAYNFMVMQIWTVDGFCRLFFKVKAHRLICIYIC